MYHSGHISFLDPDIPILYSPTTAFLSKAIQDSSRADFEKEICYIILREEQEQLLATLNYKKHASIQRQFYFPELLPYS